jgi:hypothetical protein
LDISQRIDAIEESVSARLSRITEQLSEFTQTLNPATQQVDLEAVRQDSTGLLNRPHLIYLMKQHSGRVKCFVCDERIHSDQLRIDYRPYSRTAAVKHVHLACVGRNRQLYFPARPELVSFAENEFSSEEVTNLTETIRQALPRQDQVNDMVLRLFPVVPRGDAHEREVARRQVEQRVRAENSRYLEARQDMIRRASEGLFTDRFGTTYQQAYRGVAPSILQALPRVSIPLSLDAPPTDEEEEHNCVICLEPMQGGQTIIVLPCFHRYHEGCISNWFRNSKLCPIDKLDVEKLARDGGHSQSI